MRILDYARGVRIRPRSIVGWLVICWSAFLVAAVVVGILLYSLYTQSTTEQLRRASASVVHGCAAIAARYQFAIAGTPRPSSDVHDAELRDRLLSAVKIALRDLPGVEGGIWQTGQGSLAYAFPTYEGSAEKTDVPQAEESSIRAAAEAAARDGVPVNHRQAGRSQTLLLYACPLPGPIARLSAWTMARVVTAGGRAYIQAMAGLAILLFVILGSAGWLGYLLVGWSRRLQRLESALSSSADELPKLEPTGQRDLDRIVDAINLAGARLATARREAELLAAQVAESKRLASLGRVLAGVAHEIRNPIAAMRLKAENAIAAGPDLVRKDRALHVVVEQIGRLDSLLRNLLSSVQRMAPAPKPVESVRAFLNGRAELFSEQALQHGVALEVRGYAGPAVFDAARVAQAIDNLILNAIQNTPAGGQVTICAEAATDRLLLCVSDTGAGVPEALRGQLFEPFVSGRADGTGLGLAVVREVAEAHGGTARAFHGPPGTTFQLELPWPQS